MQEHWFFFLSFRVCRLAFARVAEGLRVRGRRPAHWQSSGLRRAACPGHPSAWPAASHSKAASNGALRFHNTHIPIPPFPLSRPLAGLSAQCQSQSRGRDPGPARAQPAASQGPASRVIRRKKSLLQPRPRPTLSRAVMANKEGDEDPGMTMKWPWSWGGPGAVTR